MARLVHALFSLGYWAVIVLFGVCAFALLAFGAAELWGGLDPSTGLALRPRFNHVLEAIGLLTIAIAALELGQTVLEEEVQRAVSMSAPTRVRRFLSRFMVVVIVSLSIETLIATFQFVHQESFRLVHAAATGLAAAALLAAWGLFVRLNESAERLEPGAIEKAQQEDVEVEEAK